MDSGNTCSARQSFMFLFLELTRLAKQYYTPLFPSYFDFALSLVPFVLLYSAPSFCVIASVHKSSEYNETAIIRYTKFSGPDSRQ